MKTIITLAAVAIFLSSCSHKVIQPANAPTLQAVVDRVQDQYSQAAKMLDDAHITDFVLTEADVALKINRKNTANADITIVIFKPSGKYIRTNTTTVTYVLSKKQSTLGGNKAVNTDNTLRDAIVACVTKFHNLNIPTGTLNQLTKDHITLDVDFSVEVDASGTFTFKLWGLGTDVGLETDNTVDQDLKLTFTNTLPVE